MLSDAGHRPSVDRQVQPLEPCQVERQPLAGDREARRDHRTQDRHLAGPHGQAAARQAVGQPGQCIERITHQVATVTDTRLNPVDGDDATQRGQVQRPLVFRSIGRVHFDPHVPHRLVRVDASGRCFGANAARAAEVLVGKRRAAQEIARQQRFAYTTNTASGTVTGYRVAPGTGALTRLDASGVTGDLGAKAIVAPEVAPSWVANEGALVLVARGSFTITTTLAMYVLGRVVRF